VGLPLKVKNFILPQNIALALVGAAGAVPLALPWRQEIEDLLGEYNTAQEALLAKRDQIQFLNCDHGSFADEVQQAIQQLSNLQLLQMLCMTH